MSSLRAFLLPAPSLPQDIASVPLPTSHLLLKWLYPATHFSNHFCADNSEIYFPNTTQSTLAIPETPLPSCSPRLSPGIFKVSSQLVLSPSAYCHGLATSPLRAPEAEQRGMQAEQGGQWAPFACVTWGNPPSRRACLPSCQFALAGLPGGKLTNPAFQRNFMPF